ncbi:hypothetical protein DSECCO2_22180 [anaerobic digester metagenome]
MRLNPEDAYEMLKPIVQKLGSLNQNNIKEYAQKIDSMFSAYPEEKNVLIELLRDGTIQNIVKDPDSYNKVRIIQGQPSKRIEEYGDITNKFNSSNTPPNFAYGQGVENVKWGVDVWANSQGIKENPLPSLQYQSSPTNSQVSSQNASQQNPGSNSIYSHPSLEMDMHRAIHVMKQIAQKYGQINQSNMKEYANEITNRFAQYPLERDILIQLLKDRVVQNMVTDPNFYNQKDILNNYLQPRLKHYGDITSRYNQAYTSVTGSEGLGAKSASWGMSVWAKSQGIKSAPRSNQSNKNNGPSQSYTAPKPKPRFPILGNKWLAAGMIAAGLLILIPGFVALPSLLIGGGAGIALSEPDNPVNDSDSYYPRADPTYVSTASKTDGKPATTRKTVDYSPQHTVSTTSGGSKSSSGGEIGNIEGYWFLDRSGFYMYEFTETGAIKSINNNDGITSVVGKWNSNGEYYSIKWNADWKATGSVSNDHYFVYQMKCGKDILAFKYPKSGSEDYSECPENCGTVNVFIRISKETALRGWVGTADLNEFSSCYEQEKTR